MEAQRVTRFSCLESSGGRGSFAIDVEYIGNVPMIAIKSISSASLAALTGLTATYKVVALANFLPLCSLVRGGHQIPCTRTTAGIPRLPCNLPLEQLADSYSFRRRRFQQLAYLPGF